MRNLPAHTGTLICPYFCCLFTKEDAPSLVKASIPPVGKTLER